MDKNINIPNNKKNDDGFLMSPKIDFVFKLIFGDEKNKDILIAFLSAVLNISEEVFEGIEILNSELLREFAEDKKGILDVRVKTIEGKQIDIEIQIIPTNYMPERTMFYWSKMYTSQVKPGDTYDKLKKCITINIVNFKCIPVNKLHSIYHLKEDETGHQLTDILEIHFLEIPKLFDENITKDENDPIVEWMEFLDGESKGVMEMLAEKNKDIKKAYNILQIISKDERARMLYEAREAELRDQLTRIKSAEEKGIEKGIDIGIDIGMERGMEKGIDIGMEKGMELIAEKMLRRGEPIENIIAITDLSREKILALKTKLQ